MFSPRALTNALWMAASAGANVCRVLISRNIAAALSHLRNGRCEANTIAGEEDNKS